MHLPTGSSVHKQLHHGGCSVTDEEKRECEECHKLSYNVRRRINLLKAPTLCDKCFGKHTK